MPQSEPASDLAIGGGTWSWPFARQSYLQALTAAQPQTREESMAKALRALGQLTHLVQDSTVPAHVRNDAHASVSVFGRKLGGPDPYEDWVEDNRPDVANPVRPDDSVFRPTFDAAAPAPVAGLIDTKTFLGVNADLLSGAATGVAEYTNGNFLSKDTVFSEGFPFPRLASLDVGSPLLEADGVGFRRYFRKLGDGQPVEHFVAEGLLYRTIVAARGAPLARAFTLDRRVLQDYAQLLLPRAVGYSAALIDHFFRGELFASGDDSSVTLRNLGAEAINGAATLYYDDATGTRRPVAGASWALSLAPGAAMDGLRFEPPTDPPPLEPSRYMLVFAGALGSEPSAVVGRQVLLPSVLTARLLRHADGVAYSGVAVRTMDLRTNQGIDENVTAADGTARLRYVPEHTALVISDAGSVPGPMFWAGDLRFSSTSGAAKRLGPADLDPQGAVTVAIPFINIGWPEEIDPCTENPVFYNSTTSGQRGIPIPGGAEVLSSLYVVYDVTFTYADTGEEVDFGSLNYPYVYRSLIVPESIGRIGELVGHIHRDVYSLHNRIQIDFEGNTTAYICSNEYEAVQTIPVSIVEYDPF